MRGRKLDEVRAQALAAAFTAYLTAAREAGFSDCTPGRFLMPGDLAGSPALTFAPLPQPADTPRGSLWREMERRYDAYKREVVRPFFRDHFARIDRQVVLVDALGAIHAGPQAVEDLRRTMAEMLMAFRPGRNAFLTSIFTGQTGGEGAVCRDQGRPSAPHPAPAPDRDHGGDAARRQGPGRFRGRADGGDGASPRSAPRWRRRCRMTGASCPRCGGGC